MKGKSTGIIKMAQALVQKFVNETNSLRSSSEKKAFLDEKSIKEVIKQLGNEFLSENQDMDGSSLSATLSQALMTHFKHFRIVVNVTLAEQWGQGCHVTGKCFWDSEEDKAFSVDLSDPKRVCIISAFFIRLNDDDSDEEKNE